MRIVIAHLYPAQMNIYGDRGNIITLSKRLAWRGHQVQLDLVQPGKDYDLRKADIIFGGGGQDKGQAIIADDLQSRAANFREAVEDGAVVLSICGTYQLLGQGFVTGEGQIIPGIGIFKAKTVASDTRMIGNIVIKTPVGELVGFENHSGQTELESDQTPLGKVVKGYGNNDHSKQEGAVYKNAFGSYLHGPLLPKNPTFADELIRRALKRRRVTSILPKLDEKLAAEAAEVAKTRPR